uniref:Adaptin_N domain-containing protein n=1 Tax=Strongyloides venezuelensis TaxID=75913 RepID=A0A0K0F5S5_STRVS
MDPYNHNVSNSSMSNKALPYSLCQTMSATSNYLLPNYTNQPEQISSLSSSVTPCSETMSGGYIYPYESSYYQQQLISNNIYSNQANYPVNKTTQTLRSINYAIENSLNPLMNTYQQPITENCISNSRNFQTQQWMQNHYFDSQSYNVATPSCAPSMMSNMSHASITNANQQINCSTNGIESGKMTELKSMLKTENYPNSVVSFTENLDPSQDQLTEDCRKNILNNLLDDDIEVRSKAYKIIKYLSIEKENQARPFIMDIMNTISTDRTNSISLERLLECLCHLTYNSKTIGCIINSILDNNLIFIYTLGKRIVKDQFNRYGYGYYALSILHAILSLSGDISKILTKYTRKPFIMDRIFEYFNKILTISSANLYDQSYYFERKEIIWLIECLKHLILDNDNMKEYSLSKNGVEILLKILKGSQREYIHYHTLSCINAFIQSGSIKYVIEFVRNNLVDIAFSIVTTSSLSEGNRKIGSERVILECHKIFCSILDVDKMENTTIKNISNIIMNSLTKSDITFFKYCTWFLCRLSSKSLEFKVFLIDKDIFYLFIFTINYCLEELKRVNKQNISTQNNENIKNIEEVFDNCLITFKNLTYHFQVEEIFKVGVDKLFKVDGSLQTLMNLFIYSTMDMNKSRIIIILLRGVLFYKYDTERLPYLLDIIMKHLKIIIDVIFERSIHFNQSNDVSRKNLKNLLQKVIYFIKCLCLEYGGVSSKIREILRTNKINLLKIIDNIKDVEIRSEVIQLAGVLLNKEDNIVDKWLNNLQTQSTIKDCSSSEDDNLREVTMNFLKLAQETRCSILVEENMDCDNGISISSIYADIC